MKPMLSLTFDDGLPCQITNAMPALNERNLRATFFIIQNSPYSSFNGQVWKQARKDGHEIGAHSVDHLKPAEVDESRARMDVMGCKGFLEWELGISVTSYAYPYTHVIPAVRDEAVKNYKQARGGRVAREDKFLAPGCGVDMYNLPCFHVGNKTAPFIDEWLAEAIRRNAWVILMFHAVGDPNGWDNVDVDVFSGMLDAIVKSGISVLPMGEAAHELRTSR